MTDQLFAREISPGHWQWLSCNENGQWCSDAYGSGDSEALCVGLLSATPVNVIFRGQQVISTEVELDSKQRKHAAKLIPFELEDELSSNVDAMHFSFAHAGDKKTSVLYAEQSSCSGAIQDLDQQGCDVRTALPDYLLLAKADDEICLLLEAGIVSARLSEHWGFSAEQELAPLILARHADQSAFSVTPPERIKLIANTDEELNQLISFLPEAWLEIIREELIGSFWDCVDVSVSAGALNMRRGALSRQLPFTKWAAQWKKPAIFFALAFLCAVIVNVAAYFSAKSDEKVIRDAINNVYLDAVPNGRLGDVEGILKSKLKTVDTKTSAPSNFSYLLSKVIAVLDEQSEVTITSFSYSGEQEALQLTLEFTALSALTDIRAKLTELGVRSDSPRTTSLGDGYQARMKIQEAK